MNRCFFILIFLFIWIIFMLNQFIKIYKINKKYSNNIIFVSPDEAYIKMNKNNYINNFNKIDMKVRNCKTINDCKNLYYKNIILFSQKEKDKLYELVNKSDRKIKLFINLYNIPWKFARVSNKIDNGLPHTHDDTIYLSDVFFSNPSINTLIHEKIHVYQKKYKEKTDKLYKLYNYEKINKINNVNRRSNPDLNNFDYKHNGTIIYSEYKSNASNLLDIKLINSNKNSSKNEHPDEYFAYLITDKILNNTFNENDNELINYITY